MEFQDFLRALNEPVDLVRANADFSSIEGVADADSSSFLRLPLEPLDGDSAVALLEAIAAVGNGGDGVGLQEILAKHL